MIGALLASSVAALMLASTARADAATRASWAQAANAACDTQNAKIRGLPAPVSRTTIIADMQATIRIAKRANVDLAAIPRPASEQRPIKTLLAISGTGVQVFQQLLTAVVQSDVVAIDRLQKKNDSLGKQYNSIARRLGATVCAENPQPSGSSAPPAQANATTFA
jgi:hypothetical protein